MFYDALAARGAGFLDLRMSAGRLAPTAAVARNFGVIPAIRLRRSALSLPSGIAAACSSGGRAFTLRSVRAVSIDQPVDELFGDIPIDSEVFDKPDVCERSEQHAYGEPDVGTAAQRSVLHRPLYDLVKSVRACREPYAMTLSVGGIGVGHIEQRERYSGINSYHR